MDGGTAVAQPPPPPPQFLQPQIQAAAAPAAASGGGDSGIPGLMSLTGAIDFNAAGLASIAPPATAAAAAVPADAGTGTGTGSGVLTASELRRALAERDGTIATLKREMDELRCAYARKEQELESERLRHVRFTEAVKRLNGLDEHLKVSVHVADAHSQFLASYDSTRNTLNQILKSIPPAGTATATTTATANPLQPTPESGAGATATDGAAAGSGDGGSDFAYLSAVLPCAELDAELDFDAKWRNALESAQIHIDQTELNSLELSATATAAPPASAATKQPPLSEPAVSPAAHNRHKLNGLSTATGNGTGLPTPNRTLRSISNSATATATGATTDSKHTASAAASSTTAGSQLSRFIAELEAQLQPQSESTSTTDDTTESAADASTNGGGTSSFTTSNWSELLRQSLIPVRKVRSELAAFPWNDSAIDSIVATHLLEPAKTLFASRLTSRVEAASDEYKRLVEACTRLSNDVFAAAEDKRFDDAAASEEQLQSKWSDVLQLNESIRRLIHDSNEQKWIQQLSELERQCNTEVARVVRRHQSLRDFAETDLLLFDRWLASAREKVKAFSARCAEADRAHALFLNTDSQARALFTAQLKALLALEAARQTRYIAASEKRLTEKLQNELQLQKLQLFSERIRHWQLRLHRYSHWHTGGVRLAHSIGDVVRSGLTGIAHRLTDTLSTLTVTTQLLEHDWMNHFRHLYGSVCEKESRLRRAELHLHASTLELALNTKLAEFEWNETNADSIRTRADALTAQMADCQSKIAEVESNRERLERRAAAAAGAGAGALIARPASTVVWDDAKTMRIIGGLVVQLQEGLITTRDAAVFERWQSVGLDLVWLIKRLLSGIAVTFDLNSSLKQLQLAAANGASGTAAAVKPLQRDTLTTTAPVASAAAATATATAYHSPYATVNRQSNGALTHTAPVHGTAPRASPAARRFNATATSPPPSHSIKSYAQSHATPTSHQPRRSPAAAASAQRTASHRSPQPNVVHGPSPSAVAVASAYIAPYQSPFATATHHSNAAFDRDFKSMK